MTSKKTEPRSRVASSVVSRSGRFETAPAEDLAAFSQSVSFDWRLWRHDLRGSKAHARMLCKIGILTPAERDDIVRELERIGLEIESGRFRWRQELEDVHMNIEAELTRRVAAGAKLHTARSRNDQVALDMRLWQRDEIGRLDVELVRLQSSLVTLGEQSSEVLIPGYTHLQRGQPILAAHHLLAYVEMFDRDRDRLRDCFRRTNICPLGSGALAATTLPIDRESVARELGFLDAAERVRITQNSMDAVGDRDFAIEFCAAGALIAVHLSRLAEDVILWTSREFNFLRIADAYTTGSSLMPQKKNPDIAELARGKSGRVIGNLVSLLALLKGLPMTYNRDLQEDKERLFDTADTVRSSLRLMGAMLANSTFNEANCATAAADPQLLATDVVDYLVQKGMPFREAHHAVGAVVAMAEKTGKSLDKLELAEFQSISDRFGAGVTQLFDLRHAMQRRLVVGSPGPRQVKRQLRRWRRLLEKAKANEPTF